MHVEVDQSGKIGDTRVATVLAFSNEESCAILIPATVKRACLRELRKQGKMGTTLYIHLFATGLYLLLRDHIRNLEYVVIDVEYPGHEAKIKQHLLNLLWRYGASASGEIISFQPIGKKSNAYTKALSVFVGSIQPDKIIGTKDILSEF